MRSIDVDLGWRGGAPRLLLRQPYACDECGTQYRPVVRAGRRWLLFVPFLGLVAAGLLLVASRPELVRPLALVLVPLLVLLAFFAPRWLERDERRQPAERRVFRRGSGRAPRPGEIVLECPRCGAEEARPAS